MAGAGYKDFTAGDVLAAADVDTYLMEQAVMNFAGTAARASALPSPSTGMVTHIGGGTVQVYDGSSWTSIAGTTGKVLQVVQSIYSTIAQSSSSTYADTGLAATITPSSASSNVLVMVTHGGVGREDNNGGVGFKLFRGATDLGAFDTTAGYTESATTSFIGAVAFNYLDSPATTSATTYKTQFNNATNVARAWINNGGKASLTLLEIGA